MNRIWLFCFGYTWPEEIEWCDKHPTHDMGETSEMVFVQADSEEHAIACGIEVAEQFIRQLFQDGSYSWKELRFAHDVDTDAKVIQWARDNAVPTCHSSSTEDIAAAAIALAERAKKPS